jgi:arsenate reductase
MTDFPITLYHNPKCGTSRNTLAILQAAGYQPTVVEYLQVGWSTSQLKTLLKTMKASARDILRSKGTPAEELGLLQEGVAEDTLIAAMVAYPILVNRPIVVTPKGAKLCRPSEEVLPLLNTKPTSFTKEDGQIVAL